MKSAVERKRKSSTRGYFWPDTMNSNNADDDKCDRDIVSRELTGRASICMREWGKSLVIQQALPTC